MSALRPLLLATALATLPAACHGSPGEAPDGGTDGATRPDCATPAVLFAEAPGGARTVLGETRTLGIVLGFQGFQYANVGLSTADVLPASARISLAVQVAGKVDYANAVPSVTTRHVGVAWETDPFPVYFNDVPLSEIISRTATLSVAIQTAACVVRGHAEVTLVDGGFDRGDAAAD